MGGGLLADESSISATGNHVALSEWHQAALQAHAEDAIELFEWVGGQVYGIVDGIGVFEVTENVADQTVSCLELVARAPGSGSRKLNKEAPVPNAALYTAIRDLMIATAPLDSFSSEARAPPIGTPESLKHGLHLIAEQVVIARPKKRNAMSTRNAEVKTMRQENEAMRGIITAKTFESAVTNLKEGDALMKWAESFVGHGPATDLYASAFV